MKKPLLILMMLVLAGCSAMGSARGNQSEFEQNREKWQNARISHYRYQVHLSCFCPFTENMPLVLEVQDGEVVSMEYHNGQEIESHSRELFEKYATIDRLFAELDAAINGAADKVTLEYDPTYGFPTRADIDFIEQAIDDELYITVSNFEELP